MLKRAFGVCVTCGYRVTITAAHDHAMLANHEHSFDRPDHALVCELAYSDVVLQEAKIIPLNPPKRGVANGRKR